LDALLAGGPGRAVEPAALADDLFGVCGALESSAALRRALTDPTREASAKGELVRRLFADKVGAPAVQLVTSVVGQRWSTERDLVDTVEDFAVQALASGALARGGADAVEDELFRFERIVAGTPSLRDTPSSRPDGHGKAAARAEVSRRLAGKAQPETLRFARRPCWAPAAVASTGSSPAYLAIIDSPRASSPRR
jgi:F-type H+-transporting ATPase subunit delta